MEFLNYHHLYYFWVIAREGSITKACLKLRLAQSTLSAQLKSLEERLGHPLFQRKKRDLVLTEHGRLALVYAETIFSAGGELLDVMRNRPPSRSETVVRLGCINGIPKRLQTDFVSPALADRTTKLVMVEGSLQALVRQLRNHLLDVVISNMPVPADTARGVYNHPLGQVDIWLVGHPKFSKLARGFPRSIEGAPIFVPTYESQVRTDVDSFFERAQSRPHVRGEIEDAALLLNLTLAGHAMAVLPEITVREHVRNGKLVVIDRLTGIHERTWAITASRKIPNAAVAAMIKRFSE